MHVYIYARLEGSLSHRHHHHTITNATTKKQTGRKDSKTGKCTGIITARSNALDLQTQRSNTGQKKKKKQKHMKEVNGKVCVCVCVCGGREMNKDGDDINRNNN
jgi:hypothetical protein